jgi:hypothetical protein
MKSQCENKYYASMLAIPINAQTRCKNTAVARLELTPKYNPHIRNVCSDCLSSLEKDFGEDVVKITELA